jgi:choline dehydrogenase-like flavoprotein
MSTDRYDIIIIGSGAGGGTLALKLAPSGKRILILKELTDNLICGLSFVVTRKSNRGYTS